MSAQTSIVLVRLKRLIYGLLTMPVVLSVALVALILVLSLWIIDGEIE